MSLRHDPAVYPEKEASRFLPLALTLVMLVHVIVSLVWKVMGRVGVGAVTWGVSCPYSVLTLTTQGLIVALGSVFAGLGAWGGLV